MSFISFLGDKGPYIGAGLGFCYGYYRFKEVRNKMQDNPTLAKGLTLVAPSTVGFIIPKTVHYILTSDTVRIVVAVGIGCCLVGAVERKRDKWHETN